MKKKAALIFIGNIEFCPYRKEYESILGEMGMDYHILFWKRQDLSTDYPSNYLCFDFPSDLKKKKMFKFYDFFRYACWLKTMVKSHSYTHLVFLDTMSGMLGYLTGCISPDSCALLEIRDYTYEKIPWFRLLEHALMKKMTYVCISSKAFLRFLPPYDYCITHNFNTLEYLEFCESKKFIRKSAKEPLNIVYTGALKYFNYQRAIIEELKNDGTFNLYYHGIGPDYEKIKKYCFDNGIKNVTFTGLYNDHQKPDFYKDADFLLNCYDVSLGSEITYAISNKYYDGLIYHIPQLSESKTYKGSLVEKNKLGITWQPGEGNLKEKIIRFYHAIDEADFDKICMERMRTYYDEYRAYRDKIRMFFRAVGKTTI